MDPQAGASFIPKRPLNATGSRGGGFGLLFLIALLVFVASLVAGGAVFIYQGYLQSAIASKSNSLTLAQGAYDPDVIKDLLRLDSRINQSEDLLAKHVAVSNIFSFLSTQTLQNVSFSQFDFSLNADGSGALVLSGQADSFSTVALQSDQFGASKLLKDVVFSNIAVDATSGRITFAVNATVDPSLVLYSTSLQSGGVSAAVPAATSTSSAATSTP